MLAESSFKAATGAQFSHHKYCRAGDVSVEGMSPRKAFDLIQQNAVFLLKSGWITTLENWRKTPTWTHFDGRWIGLPDRILDVNP